MRFPIAALALVGGCATADPLVLEHRATLAYATRGMALSDDGFSGHAGMYDSTCDFRPSTGKLGADYDFVGALDTVVDGAGGPREPFATLVWTEHGLHLVRPESGEALDLGVPSPAHGAIVGEVVLAITAEGERCEGRWIVPGRAEPRTTVVLPDGACDPRAAVASDHASEVFVATDDGVLVLSEDRVERLEVSAELLAWEAASATLYAADLGGSTVRAHERDGAARWEVEVEGGVRALAHLGGHGAAVGVDASDGGRLLLLDAERGELRGELATPTAPGDLVVSDDGGTLGVVLPEQSRFYEVVAPE